MPILIRALGVARVLSAAAAAQAQSYPIRPDHHRGAGRGRRRHRRGGARCSRSSSPRRGASRSSSRTRAAPRTSPALTMVARAAPDGHTLMVAEAGSFVINPAIHPKGKLTYDEKNDFIPITGLVRINQALLAQPVAAGLERQAS